MAATVQHWAETLFSEPYVATLPSAGESYTLNAFTYREESSEGGDISYSFTAERDAFDSLVDYTAYESTVSFFWTSRKDKVTIEERIFYSYLNSSSATVTDTRVVSYVWDSAVGTVKYGNFYQSEGASLPVVYSDSLSLQRCQNVDSEARCTVLKGQTVQNHGVAEYAYSTEFIGTADVDGGMIEADLAYPDGFGATLYSRKREYFDQQSLLLYEELYDNVNSIWVADSALCPGCVYDVNGDPYSDYIFDDSYFNNTVSLAVVMTNTGSLVNDDYIYLVPAGTTVTVNTGPVGGVFISNEQLVGDGLVYADSAELYYYGTEAELAGGLDVYRFLGYDETTGGVAFELDAAAVVEKAP